MRYRKIQLIYPGRTSDKFDGLVFGRSLYMGGKSLQFKICETC